ncbi:hypothetical protein B0H16DRAFT_1560230 [Mycena metata]|uniref:DRBM domain-containing protein n=1 Tax=Mycena metata TaxID=1033252 RepID=A0AAD7N3M3_9AGAR|nr:hypothetical protein B0H16DRAFT_1560230 [Mycena metata]
MDRLAPKPQHYNRTMLNNIGQKRGVGVEYSERTTGPPRQPIWTSVVYLNRHEYGRGTASTKFKARELAAEKALALIARGY